MKFKTLGFLVLLSIALFCFLQIVNTASIDYVNDAPETNKLDDNDEGHETAFFVPYYWMPYTIDKSQLIEAIEFSAVEEAEEEAPEEDDETTPKTITEGSEEAKNSVTETDIKKDGGTNFRQLLDSQLERAFKSAFSIYVDGIVAEKQTQVSGKCKKKVEKIPARKRKEFYKCAEDKLKDLVDLGNKTIQILYDTKQLVSTAITKLKECGKKKAELVKIREEKEKQKAEEEGNQPSEEQKKKNAFYEFFRKAGRFFNENGCYIFVTGEIAINTTVLALDICMTYQDVKTTYEESIVYIKDCTTKIWDEWMVSLKCTDYVPVLDRKRK